MRMVSDMNLLNDGLNTPRRLQVQLAGESGSTISIDDILSAV